MDICGNNSKYNGWIPVIAMYPYVELKKDRYDCQAKCESDARCNGFSKDSTSDICFLSNCNKFIDTLPVSHHFASKIDPSSSVSCVQVTTSDTVQHPTTMALSTKNATKPTDITPISKKTYQLQKQCRLQTTPQYVYVSANTQTKHWKHQLKREEENQF